MERMKEAGLDFKDVIPLIKESEKDGHGFNEYKKRMYGNRAQENIRYRRNGPYIFTIRIGKTRVGYNLLVVTITDQRVLLKKEFIN